MATQIQFRRGSAAEHATFTGALGEITVDTTDDRLVVHDGSTAGGFPAAKESEIPTLSSLSLATSSTDNAVVRFNGTSGGTQNSGVTLSDADVMAGAKVLATGSTTARTLETRFTEVINVKDYGALGDNSTTDTTAVQAAIDAALALTNGATVYFPPGVYVCGALTVDLTGVGFGWGGRLRLLGDGMGLSVIRSTVTGTTPAVSITGVYDAGSGQAYATFEGFTLSQFNTAYAGYGISINGVSYLSFVDVRLTGFARGVSSLDSISNMFDGCHIDHNTRGVSAARSAYSYPNAWQFNSCHINDNTDYALIFDSPANLQILGGDCSLNGTGGATDAAIVINGNPIEGEVGLVIDGTYMEGNYGLADILIDPNNGTAGAHLIRGVGFYRISSTNYVTNHIVLDKTAAGETRVTVDTCAFSGYNSYSANASRKAIVVDTEFDTDYVIETRNNRYWSSTEAPTIDGVKIINRIPYLTGDVTTNATYAATIAANAVSNAKLRQSAGLSVVGRSANSTGDVADITAANDAEVLRRSGTAVGFGTIATAGIADAAVTYAKIQDVSATSRVLGRITAGAGDVEELTGANIKTIAGFPTTTTDNTVPRFDGTSGNLQSSSVVVTDGGFIGVGVTPSYPVDVVGEGFRVTSTSANPGIILDCNTGSGRTFGFFSVSNGSFTVYDADAAADRMIIASDGTLSATQLRAFSDVGGAASTNTLSSTSDLTANSTGVGSIKFKGTTSRDSTGFIKIYVGTTAYYVPVFSAITG